MTKSGQPQRWKDLHEALERMAPGALTEERLLRWAGRLALAPEDWGPHVRFSEASYVRSQLYRCDRFEVICCCWEPGQLTAVHDHGESFGVFLVLDGTLQVEGYQRTEDGLISLGSAPAPRGTLLLEKKGGIHRVGNPAPEARRAVSLHVYAGPLEAMTVYDPASGEAVRRAL